MSFVDDFQQLTTGRSRTSTKYTFNATTKTVAIEDFDFIRFLLIVNATDGVVIYNPLSAAQGGVTISKSINLTYDTTSMNDSDELIVLYECFESNEVINLLGTLVEQGKEQIKILKKIYSPT